MTLPAWLLCGVAVASIAWLARPAAYPAGPGLALVAGLCGAFIGGASLIVVAGPSTETHALSIYAAVVGAILMLDAAEQTGGDASAAAHRNTRLAGLWFWACLLDPLLLATMVGIFTGAAAVSAPLGALSTLATLLLLYCRRNPEAILVAKTRRMRGLR